MKQHALEQGSPAWHAHRLQHFNASDAPAMMGCSKYKTRTQLLHELKTGLTAEVDAATQRRFDDGHRFEALARPLAEEIIGEDLYPVVGTEGELSASFDGLTMDESIAFEHKTLNDDLRAAMAEGCTGTDLPLAYQVQMEQQCMVSDAGRILFMASKWERDHEFPEDHPDGWRLIEERHCWYETNQHLADDIAAGWGQFAEDLAAYVPTEKVAAVVAAAPETLPAVSVRIQGSLAVASNLPDFGTALRAFIGRMVPKPATDQEFADAEAECKALKKAEEALDASENSALGELTDVDAMRRTVADLRNLARTTRLAREKIVAAEKENRRGEIVAGGVSGLRDHIAALNARLGKPYMPAVAADFAGAIKGKKNLDSMQDAVDAVLANAKIEASGIADRIQINLSTLRELASAHAFLFPDTAQIVQKAPEDLTSLVKTRIAEHGEKERVKAEEQRAKIAAEERVKAEASVRAEQEAAATAAAPAVPATVAAPAAAPAPAPAVIAMPVRAAAAPTAHPTLSLGQIKERIAPLQITADGLATLGFTGLKERGSVLYHEAEFGHMLAAMGNHLQAIHAKRAA